MKRFILSAASAAAIVLSATSAQAAIITYAISDNADVADAPGRLSPGTLSGSFTFDTVSGIFTLASLSISGVGSNNLNGDYVLDVTTAQSGTNLRVRGVTELNEADEANTNSFLELTFASTLGESSNRITGIRNYAGNPANFSTPPTVAFAVVTNVEAAIPEPATWGMMLAGFAMVGAGFRSRRRSTTVTYA